MKIIFVKYIEIILINYNDIPIISNNKRYKVLVDNISGIMEY
jgi:hypothetical protein